jgi:perosamine synthetase
MSEPAPVVATRPWRFLRRRRYLLYPGELEEITELVLRGAVAEGDAVARFEQALSDAHAGAHVVLVNSGRVALLLLLESLGLRPGDEILVPAYTLRALLELLADQGYVPVPVDLTPGGFNLDPAQARARLGPRTRAVLATHLFGIPCDIGALAELAREHDLHLVEDCAQALGSTVGTRRVGTFGAGAILSFDLLKTINTFGGGAVVTRDAAVAERARARAARRAAPGGAVLKRIVAGLAEHGLLVAPTAALVSAALAWPATKNLVGRAYRSMQNTVRPVGARYANVQAHIGLRLLDSLDGRVAVRRALCRRLATLLGERPSADGGNGYFFVRCARGDAGALRRRLLRRGIDAGIGGEVADYCGDLGRGAECSRARAVHATAVQLPLHEGLVDDDLVRIAAACAGQLERPAASPRRAAAPPA